MSHHEITITFFTIIYGILLTDLFFSFHKLIRGRQKVKWHWLSILAAWYLFLIILKNWWDLFNSVENVNIYFFIVYGHLMLLLFLLVSNVLPDSVKEKGVDLKKYYFDNHGYFWGLMAGVVLLSLAIRFFKEVDSLASIDILSTLLVVGIYLGLLLVLAISKKYLVHALLLILFVIETLFEIMMKGN